MLKIITFVCTNLKHYNMENQKKVIRTTVKDLFHAINMLGRNVDVYVKGYGEIAVCPPVMLSVNALVDFQKGINNTVKVSYDKSDIYDMYISGEKDSYDESTWNLLCVLAGCCSEKEYEKYVEEGAII